MNFYDEDEVLQMMFTCAYAAVRTGFKHLAVRDIVSPPHGMFDAWLARQIALRIVCIEFDVPRRRSAKMLDCSRERVSRSVVTINRRLSDPVFAKAYDRMATLALDLYAHERRKAAAA